MLKGLGPGCRRTAWGRAPMQSGVPTRGCGVRTTILLRRSCRSSSGAPVSATSMPDDKNCRFGKIRVRPEMSTLPQEPLPLICRRGLQPHCRAAIMHNTANIAPDLSEHTCAPCEAACEAAARGRQGSAARHLLLVSFADAEGQAQADAAQPDRSHVSVSERACGLEF